MFRIRLVQKLLNFRSFGFDRRLVGAATRRQITNAGFNQQRIPVFAKFSKIVFESKPKQLVIGSAVGLAGVGLALCSGSGRGATNNEHFLKAVKSGNYSMVAAALKSGTDPNVRHPLGWSALHVAAVNGQREVVELLLKSGADPNLPDEYTNIYHTARDKGMHSLDVMVAREDEFSASLNMRANFRGCTPLHYAVLADDPAVVSLLLEAGADPLRSNDYGRSPVRAPSTCATQNVG